MIAEIKGSRALVSGPGNSEVWAFGAGESGVAEFEVWLAGVWLAGVGVSEAGDSVGRGSGDKAPIAQHWGIERLGKSRA